MTTDNIFPDMSLSFVLATDEVFEIADVLNGRQAARGIVDPFGSLVLMVYGHEDEIEALAASACQSLCEEMETLEGGSVDLSVQELSVGILAALKAQLLHNAQTT